jgi:hypothetical protein
VGVPPNAGRRASVTLSSQWQKHALALVERAGAVDRDYFRSVEISNAFPDDVISGEGSRLYGGGPEWSALQIHPSASWHPNRSRFLAFCL